MLSQSDIEDLIHLRRPEAEVRETMRGLTPDRLDAKTFQRFVDAMQSARLEGLDGFLSDRGPMLDCCGTGGSGLPHFNTSTTVAFVAAAGGIPIAKFGNRAATSLSGSFDLLERLGIPLETPLERIPKILDEVGMVFLFAPQFYPALKRFTALRKSLGVTTVFNYIGPLLNPANPAHRLLGVSHPTMQALMAEHLANRDDCHRALVVRGERGEDDISALGETHLYHIEGNGSRQGRLSDHLDDWAFPGDLPKPERLSVDANVRIFDELTRGDDTTSVYYETVCLNAGACFFVAEKVSTIGDGVAFARELLREGKVLETVERCRRAYANCFA